MTAKKRGPAQAGKQPAPRWREFIHESVARMVTSGRGLHVGEAKEKDFIGMVAEELVKHGDGVDFLTAVRRGRSTMRQNLRYQLLREVERLMGDAVPRRRPDANTPDSVALKKTVRLELEAYAAAGRNQVNDHERH